MPSFPVPWRRFAEGWVVESPLHIASRPSSRLRRRKRHWRRSVLSLFTTHLDVATIAGGAYFVHSWRMAVDGLGRHCACGRWCAYALVYRLSLPHARLTRLAGGRWRRASVQRRVGRYPFHGRVLA